MRRSVGLLVASFTLASGSARAGETGSPGRGVLVAATHGTPADDLRLGLIAAGFAAQGVESFVASDCVRPPPEPERPLVRGRWRLDEARRARRAQRFEAAATAGEDAIQLIERHAFERQHLQLLVEALVERGATALAMRDAGTAETVFLKALALDPLYELDPELYGDSAATFSEVRRASRELRFGSIRVEVPDVPGATVSIDFGTPKDPPVSANLSDGRHFVSVSAPSRHEVVQLVPVRAERETLVVIRPPVSGDGRARAEALETFDASAPATVRALAESTGMRFVAATSADRSGIRIVLLDAQGGQPVPNAEVTLSPEPRSDEITAATTRLLSAATVVAPELTHAEDGGPRWYTSWWAIGLLGAAVVGAGAATYLIVSNNATTLYTFEP